MNLLVWLVLCVLSLCVCFGYIELRAQVKDQSERITELSRRLGKLQNEAANAEKVEAQFDAVNARIGHASDTADNALGFAAHVDQRLKKIESSEKK